MPNMRPLSTHGDCYASPGVGRSLIPCRCVCWDLKINVSTRIQEALYKDIVPVLIKMLHSSPKTVRCGLLHQPEAAQKRADECLWIEVTPTVLAL